MTPDELESELAAGTLRPVYLVAGPEPLLRDRAVAALRTAVLGGGPADFNLDRLEGDAATPAALRDAVRALPVMAPHRLVWLRQPAGTAGREPASVRGPWKTLAEALPELVRELAADARTVLLVTSTGLDRRQAWVRAIAEAGALVECEAPTGGRELAGFVREEAKRLGIRLGTGSAERIAERVGPQLLQIRSELEKAALLAGPGREVTQGDVSRAVADVAEEPVWELTDAIGDGRVGDALAVLGKLLAAGAPAPLLLGTLAGHFRKLLRLRSGGSLAAPPFVRKKLEGQARRYAQPRLVACLRAIHDTDEALKGHGGLRPDLALERLVLSLAA